MGGMITDVCQYLRNWFEKTRYIGDFIVSDGVLSYSDGSILPILDNQYFRVIGSVFSDGVHRKGDEEDILVGEEFTGEVWAMAVPPGVLSLIDSIESWVDKYSSVLDSPFQSESKADYSYNKGYSQGSASSITWQGHFSTQLTQWRKI